MSVRSHVSSRGLLLAWVAEALEVPVLTVEVYCKWYHLQLLHPDGSVHKVGFEHLDYTARGDESPYCDHAPNPVVVRRLAKANGWHLDEQAFEMVVGRWEVECLNHYLEDP